MNIRKQIGTDLRHIVYENLRDKIRDKVDNDVNTNVWRNVRCNVGDKVWDNIWSTKIKDDSGTTPPQRVHEVKVKRKS